jgi:hypothetical protein
MLLSNIEHFLHYTASLLNRTEQHGEKRERERERELSSLNNELLSIHMLNGILKIFLANQMA